MCIIGFYRNDLQNRNSERNEQIRFDAKKQLSLAYTREIIWNTGTWYWDYCLDNSAHRLAQKYSETTVWKLSTVHNDMCMRVYANATDMVYMLNFKHAETETDICSN